MQNKRCNRPSPVSELCGRKVAPPFFVGQHFGYEALQGSIAVVLRLYQSEVVVKERLLRRWSRVWFSGFCRER